MSEEDLSALKATLLAQVQQEHSGLTGKDVSVEVVPKTARRAQAGDLRPVIRVSIHKSADDDHDHHAAADHFVSLFGDGSMHDAMPPNLPLAHVQRGEIGEWSCWFNWDSPDTRAEHEDKGDGDYEDVEHILSHYPGDEAHRRICEGGAAPTGVHCRTADHVAWKIAGQALISLWINDAGHRS